MSTVKTAISIEKSLFDDIDRAAKRLHITRSNFFSQAAAYMVDRSRDNDLLKKINAGCETVVEDSREQHRRKLEKQYHTGRISDRWK